MSNFEKYAAFYDLLYRDKDYAAEAEYVAETNSVQLFRTPGRFLSLAPAPAAMAACLLPWALTCTASNGARRWLSVAQAADGRSLPRLRDPSPARSATFARSNLGRTFDAVIALFHVMSYQTSNQALHAAFQAAARHLAPGGLFLFDVWHGPAVLSQRTVGADQGSRRRPLSREADRPPGAGHQQQHRQSRLRYGMRGPVSVERPPGSAKSI